MNTESIWLTNIIVRFNSDRSQQRIKQIVKGLSTLIEAFESGKKTEPPVEIGYNNLFEDIFPKVDVMPRVWQQMGVEEKMSYLSSAVVIYTLYKRAWDKEPRFIPGSIKKIIRMIV